MIDVDPMHYVDLQSITTADRGIVYETTFLQVSITQYQAAVLGINAALTPVSN